MDENNTEGVVIPSPLRNRDFVHYQGREYQIMKFLRATNREDQEEGIMYRVRDTRTSDVVNITLPLHIQPRQHEEGEDDYFQIVDLNEDRKEVTLKSFSTGNERKMKVRWDEDLKLIRDGLKKEDEELFCTLGRFMGKEFIGDFKFLLKDPPIMKMPDELMELIFSKLTPEDRLQCRLVRASWANFLPIKNFVECIKLTINPDGSIANPVSVKFDRLDIPNRFTSPTVRPLPAVMKDLQPLISVSLLDDVDYVSVLRKTSKSRMDHLLETVWQHCRRIVDFQFCDVSQTDDSGSTWEWAKKIISANKGHLQRLNVTTSLRILNLSETQIGECTSLQDLEIMLSQAPSVNLNLESLPSSLTSLSIKGLGVKGLTKSQLLLITTNLTQLESVYLDVHHNHSNDGDTNRDESNVEEDGDEVDENTILQMLNNHSSLQLISLSLGTSVEGAEGTRGCGRARRLRNQRLPRFNAELNIESEIGIAILDPSQSQRRFEVLDIERRRRWR